MTVPTWQEFMLPSLQILADGTERRIPDIILAVAGELGLSQSDRDEMLPSGAASKLDNRVRWALKDLYEARLIERKERGVYQITPRGSELMKEPPKSIDRRFLGRYPEFSRFIDQSASPGVRATAESSIQDSQELSLERTPVEMIETGSAILRRQLREELLERVKQSSPKFFEQLVVDLLVAMGYGGSKRDTAQALVVGRAGDEGIDGIIKEDKLGLDVIYVQAKRWRDTPVGRQVIQGFVGSLEGRQATKGIVITTSKFSSEAIEYTKHLQKKVVLIDGEYLASLMIDFQIGVSPGTSYTIRQIDEDYFEQI